MKTRAFLLLPVLFTICCSNFNYQKSSDEFIKRNNQKSSQILNTIFINKYEHRIISQGDNRPDFDRRKDSIDLFLVALHEKIHPKRFQEKAGWTDQIMKEKINFLVKKGWLLNDDKGLKPTVFIVSDKQGNELFEYGKPLSIIIAQSIEEEIPRIKEKFKSAGLSDKYNFDSLSFLILSNVLLDNWQIMEMEKDYLKKNRPERHGKYYYGGIMENTVYPKENFGIYGNQIWRINDSTILSIYGNNRNNANSRLKSDPVYRDSVLRVTPKITPALYNFFDEIAEDYKPKLIRILVEQNEFAHMVYEKTGYSDEINFEEFFIWWYHFIYTDATNILAKNNKLIIPEEGNFYYK